MQTETMIDAIHANVGNIPVDVPKVAGYVTGTPDVMWTDADWARFPHSGHVRIDQSMSLSIFAGDDPHARADIADIETDAGVIATFITAAKKRVARGWLSWAYTSQVNFGALVASVNAASLSGHVQYWLANWNLNLAEAAALIGTRDIVAVQWASPSSNPDTLVPGGSGLTLRQANVDLSVTMAGWFGPPAPPEVLNGIVVTSGLATAKVSSADGGKTWVA